MNIKRIVCALLSLVMAVGVCIPAAVQPVSAAWEDKVNEEGKPIIDYLSNPYETAQDKLTDMVLVKEQNGHQIWFEEFTGEIAYVDLASGQILFSNPWDLASSYNKASTSTKQKLLSQIIISYETNGVTKEMNSYVEAALRGQIKLKNIKNGVRVEYTIGEEQTIRLVPRMIEKSRFEELILGYIEDDWARSKLKSYYTLQDPNDLKHTERSIRAMNAKYPITKTHAIYVCAGDITARELLQLEGYIKTWCTAYSFEEQDYDHQMCGYSGSDAAPPLFKMAIEYIINDEGDLEARLPTNGIRFDESAYKLKSITFLPYFGAGSNKYTGYTLIPDGSGALVRFEDVLSGYSLSGQLYGPDYAYHTISNQHTEVMRWPVFGIVTNYEREWYERDEDGVRHDFSYAEDQGFVAIVTEGDSLATLIGEYGGSTHCYNTVYTKFNPRPSDQYNLPTAVTGGTAAVWTVESARKYTGNYRIVYKMLTDETIAESKNLKDTYSADYVGMADAYRDYLTDTGVLSPLTDTTEDMPLYIEAFGSIETTERIMTFPVTVDTPLTTFADVKSMYDELTALGVGRLNFRLTGFANGGMDSLVPYKKLNWVDALGGSDGYSDLLSYAEEKGFGVFPDFDFAYVNRTEFGDGINLSKFAVKTIDNRYTTKRTYDAALQSFASDSSLCISASVFDTLYDGFAKNYKKYNPTSISVSTLGTELSSDFDEDEPYNREDTKRFTVELLQRIDADYKEVMLDGGNAYTLAYADHILNISTDSSNFLKASDAIPFVGMVLHGSKYFAGQPINMEGDVNTALLKAIENGSSLYFILSCQNTSKLKDFSSFSKYYSVSYDIWKDSVVEYYTVLNDAIGDLQTSLIVDHELLYGERIPDEDEIIADEIAAALQAKLDEEAAALEAEKEEREKQYAAMHGGAPVEDDEEDPFAGDTEDPNAPDDGDEETEPVTDGEYVFTKYTTTKGSVVRVEYEGGVNFLLNYNSYDVTVNYGGQTYTLEALGFLRLN